MRSYTKIMQGKTRSLFFVFGYLAIPLFAIASPGQWQWRTPSPQGNTLHCIQFLNSDTGFIGGEKGAFLRTDNGGATWALSNLPRDRTLLSLEFQDARRGVTLQEAISRDQKVLYQTKDGGTTWDSLTVSHSPADYHVDWKGNNIFLADDSALRVSRNNGADWSLCGGQLKASVYSFSFPNADTGYLLLGRTSAGGTPDFQLLKTTNGCSQFDTLPLPGLSSPLTVRFPDARHGFLAGVFNGNVVLARSQDGGLTWKNSDLKSALVDIPTTYCFNDSLLGYAFGERGAALKTIDGGATWSPVISLDSMHLYLLGGFASGSSIYTIGGYGLIEKSLDGGTSWREISNTSGNSITYNDVDFMDKRIGCVVGAGPASATTSTTTGRIGRTIDGGSHWDTISIPKIPRLNSVRFGDGGLGLAVGSGGTVMRTTDGGASWSSLGSIASENLVSIRFAGNGAAYTCGGSGTIYRSNDGGVNWTMVFSQTDMTVLGMDFRGEKYGLVYGLPLANDSAMVFRTLDGGIHWTRSPFPTSHREYLGSVPRSLQIGLNGSTIAATVQGVIYRSVDSGDHWDSLSDIHRQFPATDGFPPFALLFTNPDTGFVSCGPAMVRTLDGGHSWALQEIETNPPQLNALGSSNGSDVFAVGQWGTILSYDRGTAASRRFAESSSMPKIIIDEKGIHYHLDRRAPIAAAFFRFDGTVVSRLQGRNEEPGEHVIQPPAFSGPGVMDLSIGNVRHVLTLVARP